MNEWPVTARFRKRSDVVAEEIRGWIVNHDMRPGGKLPQERDLMQLFGVSKGTVREALKSLEVQGLVGITTGPGGGAALAEVSEERAMELLGNYFYFRTPTASQIYDVRCILEPELAASALNHLSDEHFSRLEMLVKKCDVVPRTPTARRQQRVAELEFHNVLADASPNVWLSFICRFMNRLLADLVIFRKVYMAPQKEFAHTNLAAHKELLAAFRGRNEGRVRQLMSAHMQEARRHTTNLDGVVERKLLLRKR